MENTIEDFLRKNQIMECITFLRDNTKCHRLIKLLCEKIIDDKTYEKTDSFWDNYAIALFYLGEKKNAYSCYSHIFPHAKTEQAESRTTHYINNLKYSIPQNMSQKNSKIPSINTLIGNNNITVVNISNLIKNPDPKYHLFNPSITKTDQNYIINIRGANYAFDNNFKYIKVDTQEPNDGQYNTINYTTMMDDNLNISEMKRVQDCVMPYQGNYDGWEDMRIFYYKSQLHSSFTTLSATSNRLQHICLSNLENSELTYNLLNGYGDTICQKNWVPVVVNNDKLYFIYSFYPLTILKYSEEIKNVKIHQCSLPGIYNKWRGGSPAISLAELGFPEYYICIIHESNFPEYKHKFVLLKINEDDIFEIYNCSPDFYFITPIIEVCMGMVISHDKKNFLLSFGKMDREVYIARINIDVILHGLFSQQLNLILRPNLINNTTLNSPYTFVSCFFNLEKLEKKGRWRSIDTYLEKSKFLLNLDVNLVVFVDDDEIVKYIEKIRKRYMNRTKIIKMNITELPYYTHFDVINNIREKYPKNGIKDTPAFAILMWSKFYFLQEAIKKNYFLTDQFMWVDFGITHIAKTENYIDSFNSKSEKISIQCITLPTADITKIQELNVWKCYLGGGIIGGNTEYMLKLIDKFNYYLTFFIQNNVAPLEDNIVAYIFYKHPELFEPYYGHYASIINDRPYCYTNIHNYTCWIFDNAKKALLNNMVDHARHIIKYILHGFLEDHINLTQDLYEQIMNLYNCLFFLP